MCCPSAPIIRGSEGPAMSMSIAHTWTSSSAASANDGLKSRLADTPFAAQNKDFVSSSGETCLEIWKVWI